MIAHRRRERLYYIIWASNRLQLLQSRPRNMSRDSGVARENTRWQEGESVGHWGRSYEFRPRGICTLLKRVAQTEPQ